MRQSAAEVQQLLDLIHPNNDEVVALWAEALGRAGGIYAAMDLHGRRGLAGGTLAAFGFAVVHGAFPDSAVKRFVEPPPYRHQPSAEFLLATIEVSRALAAYIRAQPVSSEAQDEAIRRMSQVLATAGRQVIEARGQRWGTDRLVKELGRFLARSQSPRAALASAAERLAAETGSDLCMLLTQSDHELAPFATHPMLERLGLSARLQVSADALDVQDRPEDETVWIRPIDPGRSALEAHLVTLGLRSLAGRTLLMLGNPVGCLLVASREDSGYGPRVHEILNAASPLLSAALSQAQQVESLERANTTISALFDVSPNMMCSLDHLGRIIRTNQQFRDRLGVPGDVVGMPLAWLVHPAWLRRFTDLWDRIRQSSRVDQARVDLITAWSERLPLALEARWLHEEGTPGRTCTVGLWNVAKQVAREAADQQRIDELTAFAHHVAHDLKAPLRTIAGFAALLEEDLPEDLSPKLRDYVHRVQAAAEKGGDLVTGLLRFASATDLPGTSRAVPLDELLDDVRVQLAAELESRGGQLVVTASEAPLLGNPTALITLLINLVGNALRYTDGPSPVVEVGITLASPGWATLAVADHGIGIDPADQERVFGLFERCAPNKPGTGVGLAVVRRIARLHGGDVRVHSVLGEGSRFEVTLPTP